MFHSILDFCEVNILPRTFKNVCLFSHAKSNSFYVHCLFASTGSAEKHKLVWTFRWPVKITCTKDPNSALNINDVFFPPLSVFCYNMDIRNLLHLHCLCDLLISYKFFLISGIRNIFLFDFSWFFFFPFIFVCDPSNKKWKKWNKDSKVKQTI